VLAATAFGEPGALRALTPAALALYPAAYVSHFLFGPLFEETGWRGFRAAPPAAPYGPVRASLLLGVLWSCWHFLLYVPAWLSAGTANGVVGAAVFVVTTTAMTFVFTWVFNNPKGSLLLMILLHGSVDGTATYLQDLADRDRIPRRPPNWPCSSARSSAACSPRSCSSRRPGVGSDIPDTGGRPKGPTSKVPCCGRVAAAAPGRPECRLELRRGAFRAGFTMSPPQLVPSAHELQQDHRKLLTDSRKVGHYVWVASTPDYAEQLRTAALRVTRPRVAVLEAVSRRPHADTETIFGAVRGVLPDVSRQAVYDVLNALTAVGLVRRIQPSGLVARYESRVADNHHHMVCRACGAIADVDCAVGEAPCLTPADGGDKQDGFVVHEAEVIYWGLCSDCSASQNSGSPR